MAKTRWLAEWVTELGSDDNGDANPHKNKHAQKAFPTRWDFDSEDNFGETDPVAVEAARYGCGQNCYGPECFIYLEEYRFDGMIYEEIGRKVYSWSSVEKYLCADGEVVERVD